MICNFLNQRKMNTFVINQTLYERGLRPRGYFPERKKMFQGLSQKTYELLNCNASLSNEKTAEDFSLIYNEPGKRVFFETIAWALFLSLLMYKSISLLF